jgi:hypothetical protein
MFTHVNATYWKNAITYINDAIVSYSRWIGEYPYDVCTAVQGALSAGGGMEYPTITIIGQVNNAKALETVILHEVGHNWFQGILGSNERLYPWMDEGINSFYEQLHLKQKYPDHYLIGKQKGINKYLGTDFFRENELLKPAYQAIAGLRKSQPLGLSSERFTQLNYGVTVYGKGAWAMEYLRAYLGDSVFDAAMHEYFNRWQWKHPQPDDLKNVMEEISGKNLHWFFNDLLHSTTEPHYKITSVKPAASNSLWHVRLKNKNSVLYPISVGVYNKNYRKNLLWLDGFKKDTTVVISKDTDNVFFCLDCENTIPTVHRPSFYKQKKFKIKFMAAYDRPDQLELFFAPWLGWNNYDKTTLGIALYNHTIPHKNFTFELLPQYAFGTKTAVGMGRAGYTFFLKKEKLHHVDFSVSGRRFGWQLFPEALMYHKLQPALSFQINPKHPRSPINRMLVLRNINIWQETNFYNLQEKRKIFKYQYYYINEAAFYCRNSRVLNPISWSVHLQQSAEFVKLFAEANFIITYNKPKKGLHIRYFIGGFAWENISTGNVPDPRLRMNFSSGFGPFIKDYTFDELLLGRSDYSGFFSQQIVYRDGGFKTLTSLGQTNRWLSAVNISSTIPGRVPLKPFIGIGAYGDTQSRLNMAFEAGLTIFLLSDILELHLPLVTLIQANFGTGKQTYKWHIGMRKNDTDNMHMGTRYRNLITFTFNLQKLNPFELLKKLEF